MRAVDVIVKTESPYDILDMRMLSFGAMTSESPVAPGVFRVRCLRATLEEAQGHADFIKSVVTNQGYGEVLRTEEVA